MSKRAKRTFYRLLVGYVGFMIGQVAQAGDPFTKPEFVIPQIGMDLSARRLDAEIVGWDKNYQHLAAIGVDTIRERDGRHRGNVFLWIFPILEMLPQVNVRLHHISHAPHPHDPIPIEDARDLTWTIETPLLWRWPKRPIRKQPKFGMYIQPTWYFQRNENDLCNVYVGAGLQWKSKKKVLFTRPLDLSVLCNILTYTDYRVYWGKEDTAGVMIRFDFPKQSNNERSARFIVPINWQQGRTIRCLIESKPQYLAALAAYFTPFSNAIQTKKRSSFSPNESSFITVTEENKAFAQHLTSMLGNIPVHTSPTQKSQADVVLVWANNSVPPPVFMPKQPL